MLPVLPNSHGIGKQIINATRATAYPSATYKLYEEAFSRLPFGMILLKRILNAKSRSGKLLGVNDKGKVELNAPFFQC
jgi:hypothetical protein